MSWKPTRKFLLALALFATVSSGGNRLVDAALIINLDSAANNSTPDVSTGTATDKREFNSVLDTIIGSDSNGDFVGSTVTLATRLSALTVADKDSNTNTFQSANTQNATVNYSLTFTVSNPGPGRIYDVTIDTLRRGELTVRNESTGHGGNATLTLGAITASYLGAGSPVGSNNLAGASFTSPNSNNANEYFNIDVNQAGQVVISGLTGEQTITLGFSWVQNVTSINAGGLFNNGQGDDGAIRLGRTTTTDSDAGQYPGNNGRDINLDGHFVNITAEIVAVPEPGTFVMAGMAGLGLGMIAWRKRRRS